MRIQIPSSHVGPGDHSKLYSFLNKVNKALYNPEWLYGPGGHVGSIVFLLSKRLSIG